MDGSEDDKRPIGAMPKARQDHGDEKILGCFPIAPSAATEGDVKIVAQPGAKTDMPATPEVLKAVREEGLAEIDHEMEAHQLG